MTPDVDNWIAEISLAQYAAAFRANDVDATLLRGLSADELKGIGVTSWGIAGGSGMRSPRLQAG